MSRYGGEQLPDEPTAEQDDITVEDLQWARGVLQNRRNLCAAGELSVAGFVVVRVIDNVYKVLTESGAANQPGYVASVLAGFVAVSGLFVAATNYGNRIGDVDAAITERQSADDSAPVHYPYVPIEGEPVDPNMYNPESYNSWMM